MRNLKNPNIVHLLNKDELEKGEPKMDVIQTKFEKAQKKHYETIEELVRAHLPKDYEKNHCEWRADSAVRGANTLFYKDKPVITLFPVETKQKMSEDEKLTLIIEQKYLSHEDNN